MSGLQAVRTAFAAGRNDIQSNKTAAPTLGQRVKAAYKNSAEWGKAGEEMGKAAAHGLGQITAHIERNKLETVYWLFALSALAKVAPTTLASATAVGATTQLFGHELVDYTHAKDDKDKPKDKAGWLSDGIRSSYEGLETVSRQTNGMREFLPMAAILASAMARFSRLREVFVEPVADLFQHGLAAAAGLTTGYYLVGPAPRGGSGGSSAAAAKCHPYKPPVVSADKHNNDGDFGSTAVAGPAASGAATTTSHSGGGGGEAFPPPASPLVAAEAGTPPPRASDSTVTAPPRTAPQQHGKTFGQNRAPRTG